MATETGEIMRFSRSLIYDIIMVTVLIAATAVLAMVPTGFEHLVKSDVERVEVEVLETDDTEIHRFGIVRQGDQYVTVRVLEGTFEGQTVTGVNILLGKMELDKVFSPGDRALAVITKKADGSINFANIQDHYRIDTQKILLGLFALLLLGFAGWTGAKALLSFIFSGVVIWKVLVPCFLKGYDPVLVSLGSVAVMTAAIIFLVGGINRRGLVAFLGAFLGILATCALALGFSGGFQLHGAVKPFSETLLYSGFPHLDLTRIFLAAIFMASSGAVMDLAMDVSASMHEVVDKKPGISRAEALLSGLRVGRAVVGTMTTTLLLAYSGGYITLLMVFVAQGVPFSQMININYVSAEVLNTLVGSFGLVLVAPFTAVVGSFLFVRADSAA